MHGLRALSAVTVQSPLCDRFWLVGTKIPTNKREIFYVNQLVVFIMEISKR